MSKVKEEDKNLIAGLDIGTTKVMAIIGEVLDDGIVHVIGIGTSPSRGLKRGVVVNIDATVNSIQRAVEEAELMAGYQIQSVYTGIAGSHIRSLNSHGIVAIREQEVTVADVERVIDAASAVAIPADQKVLHVLPQEFIVDNQDCIREPLGMSGVRLEAKVHIVSGAVSAAQNIVKCVWKCGLEVSDIILEQLASCYAVLSEDEKDLGICLVDLGGGTTDLAIFNGGAIRHTSVIPIAGNQVTKDIAFALRTSTQNAEEIKINYACALTELTNPSDMFEVFSVGNRPQAKYSKQFLAEICESRYEELFTLIRGELRRSGFENLIAAGIVLTGGAAMMPGLLDLAERVFQAPVRLGAPEKVTGLIDINGNPKYSTSIGLLLYGHDKEKDLGHGHQPSKHRFKNLWQRMWGWFSKTF